MQFIASLIGSLAWPIVVLVVALLFRTKIIEILSPTMRRLKAGPFEVEWDRTIAEAEQDLAVEGPVSAEDALKATGPISRSHLDLALRDPAFAISLASRDVETILFRYLSRTIPKDQLRGKHSRLVQIGIDQGAFPEDIVRALQYLARLQNMSSHARDDLTAENAVEYLMLADYVANKLS